MPAPGKLPLHLEGAARRRRPRTTSASHSRARTGTRARVFLRRRGAVAGGGHAVAERRRRLLRRDVLVERRAGRGRSGHARAPRTWPTGRSAARAAASQFLSRPRAGRRIYIHINNTNPILREDGAERARGRRRGRGDRARRHGARAVSERRACCRPTNSSRGCATRASAATTTSTRSTSDARRASSRASSSQAWALNRYYYQTRIPIKDALILSKSEDPGVPAPVDPPHPRSRRRGPEGRARAVAAARRGGRARPRRGRELPRACCRASASPATPT